MFLWAFFLKGFNPPSAVGQLLNLPCCNMKQEQTTFSPDVSRGRTWYFFSFQAIGSYQSSVSPHLRRLEQIDRVLSNSYSSGSVKFQKRNHCSEHQWFIIQTVPVICPPAWLLLSSSVWGWGFTGFWDIEWSFYHPIPREPVCHDSIPNQVVLFRAHTYKSQSELEFGKDREQAALNKFRH